MNILLINVNGLFGEGLKRLMRDVTPSLNFDTAEGIYQTQEKFASGHYDFAMLDLDSVEISQAANILRGLVSSAGKCPLIVLSDSESSSISRVVLNYGVRGYVSKSARPDTFIDAVRVVMSGRIYRPGDKVARGKAEEAAMQPMASDIGSELKSLTPRQLDVLKELAQGKPNKLIARDLAVSENTVKTHVSAVFRVLGARNRTDAVCQAAKLQLVL